METTTQRLIDAAKAATGSASDYRIAGPNDNGRRFPDRNRRPLITA